MLSFLCHMSEFELKPNKSAFIYYNLIKSILFFSLLAVIGFSFGFRLVTSIIVGVWFIYRVFSLFISYSKENYVFEQDRVIWKRGSIFSDSETELMLKNVTHVKLEKPFLENMIFSTGDVIVEAAGGGGSEIMLRSVDKPDEMYSYMEELLQGVGFEISRDDLVQKESPDKVGVAVDVGLLFLFAGLLAIVGSTSVGRAITTLLSSSVGSFVIIVGGFLIGMGAFALLTGYMNISSQSRGVLFALFVVGFSSLTSMPSNFETSGLLFGIPLGLGAITHLLLYAIDLSLREYFIYEDNIDYTEGFLTKHRAFLPVENLSDSETTRGVVEKMLGLYNIVISSPGAGREVTFRNVRNGKEMEENIDSLISQKDKTVSERSLQKGGESKVERSVSDVTGELNMEFGRTAFSSAIIGFFLSLVIISQIATSLQLFNIPVLATFFVVFILLSIAWAGLKVHFYSFHLRKKGVEERFEFLWEKNREFSFDKVTGVVVKENLIDWIFNTFTLKFLSIGSVKDVSFKNVAKDDKLVKQILEKKNIRGSEKVYEIQPEFGFTRMIRAFLPLTVLLLGVLSFFLIKSWYVLSAIIVVAVGLIAVYKKFYFDRQRLTFFDDHVYFKEGIFFTSQYHISYDDVKDIETKRWPFCSYGSIKFNIAGEHIVGSGKNKRVASNSFKVSYVPGIRVMDDLIDVIFYSRPSAKEFDDLKDKAEEYARSTLESEQDIWNHVIPSFFLIALVTLFVPAFQLWVGLGGAALLGYMVIYLKNKSYSIQSYRVVGRRGVFYKVQKSIIFPKIDFIGKEEGFLNKIFDNGKVKIQTIGSSTTELTINNIEDVTSFHKKLQKNYQQG